MNQETYPFPKQYNQLADQQDSIYNVNHNWTSLSIRNEALAVKLGAVIVED